MRSFHRLRFAALVALAIPSFTGAALAQDRPGLFGNIFNRGDDQGDQQQAAPQGAGNDSAMRLDRIENSLRQLTGTIEQLQYQNQQLQTQVRELQSRAGIAPQAAPGAPVGSLMPQRPASPQPMPQSMPQQPAPTAGPGKRSDVFDPNAHPDAPGAPTTLFPSAPDPAADPIRKESMPADAPIDLEAR